VRLVPAVARQQPKPQELARLDAELVEAGAGEVQRDHARAFLTGLDDPQPVPVDGADRQRDAIRQQQRRHHQVHPGPQDAVGAAVDEVGTRRELVQERDGHGEVGRQVNGIPRLVGQPAPGRPRRGHTDGDEQRPADRRQPHVGVAGPQRPGLPRQGGVGDDGGAPEDEGGVQAQQAYGVPPGRGVPASQPVGAHTALDCRDPGHQGEQHDDRVAAASPVMRPAAISAAPSELIVDGVSRNQMPTVARPPAAMTACSAAGRIRAGGRRRTEPCRASGRSTGSAPIVARTGRADAAPVSGTLSVSTVAVIVGARAAQLLWDKMIVGLLPGSRLGACCRCGLNAGVVQRTDRGAGRS
jgi:hypothetical protein